MDGLKSATSSSWIIPLAIHTGGDMVIVANLLWDSPLNSVPSLRVLIVYLPTHSPELNPIELLFHVLARRIQSW